MSSTTKYVPAAGRSAFTALYDPALLPKDFTTFADLGCNVGYFTCWLVQLAQGRKIKGLMLDANPEAVKEAQWRRFRPDALPKKRLKLLAARLNCLG